MNRLKHNFWLVIESIYALLRTYWIHYKEIMRTRKRGRELNMRIAEANEMNRQTKKTYWVKADYNGTFRILDKSDIRNLKRAKIMNREVTIYDMLLGADYCTMNNHFVVLVKNGSISDKTYWFFFRGTILECIDKCKNIEAEELQILGGFERVVTIQNGKVIKH